ncbi:hypothetical protein DPMN_011052 [Dreissena polymorpha]|uniref:Uncharacterized protein n=1 Tax=Dreissena polymorpha TaxID=45954 RepID=A0A9D4RZM3_DREPO|nr:hypothetical protein DPMN_011052 [Dreissena polymorpha]
MTGWWRRCPTGCAPSKSKSPMDSRISDVIEGNQDERRQPSSDDTFGRRCYRAGRL